MKLREKIIEYLVYKSPEAAQDKIIEQLKDLSQIISDHVQLINDENKLEWVSIQEILYIDRDKHYCEIITKLKKYKHCFSFEATQEITNNFNFDVCDNRILVNLDQIKKIDGERGLIYFDNEITKDSISTTMSNRTVKRYQKKFGEEIDVSIREVIKEKGLKALKNSLYNLL